MADRDGNAGHPWAASSGYTHACFRASGEGRHREVRLAGVDVQRLGAHEHEGVGVARERLQCVEQDAAGLHV